MIKNEGICEGFCVHEEAVTQARAQMLPEITVDALAELFKVLGDSTRIKILQALSIQEMCVCDLSVVLCLSQSAVSHQLKTLKQAKLVKFRKEGKNRFYALDDAHVNQIFSQGLEHVKHG
jgi:DNA-binding transcriptional ArsR family regulator